MSILHAKAAARSGMGKSGGGADGFAGGMGSRRGIDGNEGVVLSGEDGGRVEGVEGFEDGVDDDGIGAAGVDAMPLGATSIARSGLGLRLRAAIWIP